MRIFPKTKILLATAVCLLALNWWDQGVDAQLNALPEFSAMTQEQIQKVQLQSAAETIILEKEDDVWWLRAPIQAKADQARVKALILNFRKSISMDVLLERENQEQYGLDAGNGIVAEFWTNSQEPEISFTLGFDFCGHHQYGRCALA